MSAQTETTQTPEETSRDIALLSRYWQQQFCGPGVTTAQFNKLCEKRILANALNSATAAGTSAYAGYQAVGALLQGAMGDLLVSSVIAFATLTMGRHALRVLQADRMLHRIHKEHGTSITQTVIQRVHQHHRSALPKARNG